MARYTPTPTTATLRRVTTFLVPICILFVLIVGPLYHIFIVGLAPAAATLVLNGLLVVIQRRHKWGISRLSVAFLDTIVGFAYLGGLLPQWVGDVRAVQHVENQYNEWEWGAETMRRRNLQFITLITFASSVFLVNMYVSLSYPSLFFLGRVIPSTRLPKSVSNCLNESWSGHTNEHATGHCTFSSHLPSTTP